MDGKSSANYSVEDGLMSAAAAAKAASLVVAQASTEVKNRALAGIARSLRSHEAAILRA